MLSFFPRGVWDEILNLIESVSEGFPSYSPFSCYSKENFIVKYLLLSLSGFPYRITQYILKFPILIILISLPLIHLYIKLREHVHKNTNGAIDKLKKRQIYMA